MIQAHLVDISLLLVKTRSVCGKNNVLIALCDANLLLNVLPKLLGVALDFS